MQNHKKPPLTIPPDAWPRVALEYYRCTGRLIVLANPQLEHDSSTGRTWLITPTVANIPSVRMLIAGATEDPTGWEGIRVAYLLRNRNNESEYQIHLASAPTLEEAYNVLNEQLAAAFIAEVGMKKGARMFTLWLLKGPGFLARLLSTSYN